MNRTQINNPNAMTGMNFVCDLLPGFYNFEMVGNIDAPMATVLGSTIANEINYPKNHSCANLNGRHIIANIRFRG